MHIPEFTETIEQYPNGEVIKKYYKYNVLHNDNGPARIIYNKSGDIIEVTYCTKGIVHREDGPALINYANGHIQFEAYILNGTRYLPQEFKFQVFKYKLLKLLRIK